MSRSYICHNQVSYEQKYIGIGGNYLCAGQPFPLYLSIFWGWRQRATTNFARANNVNNIYKVNNFLDKF